MLERKVRQVLLAERLVQELREIAVTYRLSETQASWVLLGKYLGLWLVNASRAR